MLITGFAAGPLAANCYVLAPDDGRECVVVDPGQRSVEPLRALLTDRRLRPVAVLATHGHFDHVAGAAHACESYDVPLYIGAGDEDMLADPWSAISPELAAGVRGMLEAGESLDDLRPSRVVALGDDDAVLDLAGVSITAIPVPGHTAGAVTYRLEPGGGEPTVLLTGDTLFAGSIGRTDLPGGSTPQILDSIRRRLLAFPDETVVLPGHGPATTIGAERRSNPFL